MLMSGDHRNIGDTEDRKKEGVKLKTDGQKRKRTIRSILIITGILSAMIIMFAAFMNSTAPAMDLHSQITKDSGQSGLKAAEKNNLDKAQKAVDELYRYIEQENLNFKIDTRADGWNLIKIYDNSELENVFGISGDELTYDDIINDIKKNSGIASSFKSLFITFANNLRKQYPSMDLRIWHINLQTLKIVEVSEMEMRLKAMSGTAYAVYRQDENTIYTVNGYEYIPGTWEYQVIMHEMGHTIRSLITHCNGDQVKVRFQSCSGYGTITGEALNSLLTLRSYDAEERDIAYQLQSNMVELMVTEMDNYTYQDFVEHNLTYFEQKLNEYNGNTDAVEMIGLLELQYQDYHNKDYEINETLFHKLYDYIADMYYQNHLHPDMTENEMLKVRDDFIDRLTYDVPEEYHISIDHIKEHFEELMEKSMGSCCIIK